MAAFPRTEYDGSVYEGMTLRDYFAAKALPEMIAINEKVTKGRDVPYNIGIDATARACYEIADAMMKARES